MPEHQTDNALNPTGLDAYKPAEIANLVERAGTLKVKANTPGGTTGELRSSTIAVGAGATFDTSPECSIPLVQVASSRPLMPRKKTAIRKAAI